MLHTKLGAIEVRVGRTGILRTLETESYKFNSLTQRKIYSTISQTKLLLSFSSILHS